MQSTFHTENLPGLLLYLVKSAELWFYKVDQQSTTQLVEAINLILLNGLKYSDNCASYQQFLNDLFWLNAFNSKFDISLSDVVNKKQFSKVLSLWIYEKFGESSLCSNLQLLLSDKELMETHYTENAFLRDEIYSNACLICISAVELRKPVLLNFASQSLYIPVDETQQYKSHRRSSSHPHFSTSPNTKFKEKEEKINSLFTTEIPLEQKTVHDLVQFDEIKKRKSALNLSFAIARKCKSLPNIAETFKQRPRSQTVSQPMSIPQRDIHQLKYRRLSGSSPKIDVFSESQLTTPDDGCKVNFIVCSSSDGTFRDTQSSYDKGAIKKKLTPEKSQHNKKLSSCRYKSNKTIKYNKSNNYLHNSADIKIHFDRDDPNAKIADLNKNEKVNHISSSLTSTSSKGISPISFLSSMSKNIFSPKSDPISIRSCDKYSMNSNSSSIAGSFSNSLSKNDVLSSFGCTRDGEKLIKAHVNVFDDLMLTPDSSNLNSNNSRSNTIFDDQNLASLLKTNLFSSNHTDLERENAHFKISEAVISVIEHIKWTKAEGEIVKNLIKKPKNAEKVETDPIKDKSEAKKTENIDKKNEFIEIVETATSYLDTKEDSSAPSTAESANEDKDYDELLDSYDNVHLEHVAYAEWGCGFDSRSAENVGLSLISKFNDTDLPRVAELKWLVSEEICTRYNVPQDLLPIPDVNISENPDDHVVHQIQRGTRDWAPPRKQIIFTDHHSVGRKTQMQKQNYRCAGCGMRVAPIYSNRFRYCHYLGKYHCTGCHRNHKSIIPAKVLKKWDFGLYPVSVFSYRLLEEIWQYPLFILSHLAPTLYKRVRSLAVAKLYRTQLKYLKDFITTCRFSQNEEKLFYEIQTYVTVDPDKWSMSDFVDTKEGTLQKNLKIIIDKCERHISNCVLCAARGFICEICFSEEPVYPWQVKVTRCEKCGTCYHIKCFQSLPNGECRKCYRLTKKCFDVNDEKMFNEALYCI
ncbi:run domain Beclin-1-interacting and cysteine-rich domain-containing protein isoform X2 [Condylostylus longicornis]|uniref:run domain Beclin-1-interacting and cysteine-rich domain-containing protein isoform X2 n=1 Tax=Condylostylus longicornis TaxID=2530218 RepID=UPI00244E3EE8|nr:run domain Beclin-1-interacting and cysteine-rich domain-containing protein isoform X2 [Condylostylus longicornis]